MNSVRLKILNFIGYLLHKFHRTWLHHHIKGACQYVINNRLCRSFKHAENVYINAPMVIIGGKYITIGENTRFDIHCFITAYDFTIDGSYFAPEIQIGDCCSFGAWNHISSVNKIIIGSGFLSGKWVTISDNNHGDNTWIQMQRPPLYRPTTSKGSVVIGKNVWVGDKVTILSGVCIGDGAVIAANSVVSNDVPSYTVVAGNPAKIIKQINPQ